MTMIIDGTNGVTFPNTTVQAVAGLPLTGGNLSGSIAFTASNAGITFANSSALVNSQLNDYEIGTCTLTWWSGANGTGTNLGTTSTNRYTKIGRFVSINFQRSGVGSGNCLSFTGLPFAASIDGSASGVTADSAVFYFDLTYPTYISYRGAGDGLYSRGTVNYSTSF